MTCDIQESAMSLQFRFRASAQTPRMREAFFLEIQLDLAHFFQNLKSSDTLEGRDPLSKPIFRDRVANNHRQYSCFRGLVLLDAGQGGLLVPAEYAGVGSRGHPSGTRLVGILYAPRAPR